MTEWTTHTPRFDGDAPEGVGLDTHEIETTTLGGWWSATEDPRWYTTCPYRYRPRMEDVKG